jgi:hypothetical protein
MKNPASCFSVSASICGQLLIPWRPTRSSAAAVNHAGVTRHFKTSQSEAANSYQVS